MEQEVSTITKVQLKTTRTIAQIRDVMRLPSVKGAGPLFLLNISDCLHQKIIWKY